MNTDSSELDQSEWLSNSQPPHSIRRWLPVITIEGALANVFTVLTGGAFLTGLALWLGANDFQIGLLAAIPFLAQVTQLLSAYLVDKTGHRKTIAIWASVLARQIWWVMFFLLLVPISWRLHALIAVVFIYGVAIMLATPAWTSWMSDIIPDEIRGRYFGYRSAAVGVTTLGATIFGGILLDKLRALGRPDIGFAVIVGTAGLFALIAVILLSRIPDRLPSEIRIGFDWERLIAPIKDRTFRHLLRVFFVWNMAIGLASPFFAAQMLNNLKMSFTQVSIYTCVFSIVAIVLYKPWGELIDRFGSKPVIVFCAFGLAIVPLVWWIPRQGYLWILWFEAIYSGALWAGFNLGTFNIPIANSPKEGRTIYIAMFSLVTGLGFFIASLLGGALSQNWSHFHWQAGKQTIVNYHLIFALSGGLRFLAAFLILTFREPMEKSLPDMIQFMGYAALKRLLSGR